jgi:hypothetical protein
MSSHILMNTSGAMLCVNLDTTDEQGRRLALILHDRERSRPLGDAELASSEVQKLLARGDLRDVTNLDATRPAPAGRLRRPEAAVAEPAGEPRRTRRRREEPAAPTPDGGDGGTP